MCMCFWVVEVLLGDFVNKGWIIPPLAGRLPTRDYCKYLRGTVDMKITLTNGYISLDSKRALMGLWEWWRKGWEEAILKGDGQSEKRNGGKHGQTKKGSEEGRVTEGKSWDTTLNQMNEEVRTKKQVAETKMETEKCILASSVLENIKRKSDSLMLVFPTNVKMSFDLVSASCPVRVSHRLWGHNPLFSLVFSLRLYQY